MLFAKFADLELLMESVEQVKIKEKRLVYMVAMRILN
jgi:hypothetical protein